MAAAPSFNIAVKSAPDGKLGDCVSGLVAAAAGAGTSGGQSVASLCNATQSHPLSALPPQPFCHRALLTLEEKGVPYRCAAAALPTAVPLY